MRAAVVAIDAFPAAGWAEGEELWLLGKGLVAQPRRGVVAWAQRATCTAAAAGPGATAGAGRVGVRFPDDERAAPKVLTGAHDAHKLVRCYYSRRGALPLSRSRAAAARPSGSTGVRLVVTPWLLTVQLELGNQKMSIESKFLFINQSFQLCTP